MEILTKYGNWKSRIADVNERDSARILLYGGRYLVIPFKCSFTEFVKRNPDTQGTDDNALQRV